MVPLDKHDGPSVGTSVQGSTPIKNRELSRHCESRRLNDPL
jgi:hypothetical protein